MDIRYRVFSILVTLIAVLAPLPYGAISPQSILILVGLLAVALALSPLQVIGWQQIRALAAPLALVFVYCVAALAQSLPGALPDAGIWAATVELLGTARPATFSVDPDRTRSAIGLPLLLALALLAGLGLSMLKGQSDRLLRALGAASVAYALLALAMHFFSPMYVLFTPKATHFTSLTGTFFNRNTEAAFLGLGLVIRLTLLGEWIRHEQPFRKGPLISLSRMSIDRGLLLRLLALMPILAALMLTRSRAGIILGFISASLCIVLLASTISIRRFRSSRRASAKRRREEPGRKRRLTRAAPALIAIAALFAVGSAGIDARISDEGLGDEARALTYSSTLDLIAERPLAGHGIGTFELVFPAKRKAEAAVLGIWTKAHSTLIELAVEVGIPFALAVAVAYVALLLHLIRAMLANPERSLLLVASIVLLQSGVHSLVDYPLQIPGFAVLVALLTGAAAGIATRLTMSPAPAPETGTPEVKGHLGTDLAEVGNTVEGGTKERQPPP